MNQIYTSEGNIMFVKANGKITNVHPFNVYTHFNKDTVSFVLIALPESSGLSFFTSKADDLEIDGEQYTFDELKEVIPEKFKMSGAQARCEIVEELPTTGQTNTIYLVPIVDGTQVNRYDEYIYIKEQEKWELLGDTSIEMDRYYTKTQVDEKLSAKADTATTYTKTQVDTLLNDKQDTLTAGDGIEINNNVISFDSDKERTIATALSELKNEKLDASAFDAYSAETDTAIANKQDTLVSGTNIKTINNESILGSGNITIEGGGGGKAVSGGTNISVTTGETADTINCTLPITATSSVFDTISVGKGSGGGSYNTIIGPNARCDSSSMYNVFLVAQSYNNSGTGSYVNGSQNVIIGSMKDGYTSWDIPSFSTSQSVVIGGGHMSTDKNNSLAIGYNANVSGTTKTNINNQLKIDTSNQVYIYNKDNTEMICLQDQLGGGGSSYTAGDGIDITNDVISVTGKVDTSAITTSITSANTNTQLPSAKAVYDQLGGLKLVKLSQSAYDSLATKDSMTLYIIEEALECNIPSTATWHGVDTSFDRTTQIYGVDFSNGDGGNDGTGRDYSLYVRNQSNTVYIINCHIPDPNDESGDYNSITINNSDGSLYRQLDYTAIINSFCDIFGEPMYISANATIPSYEQCVDEQCTEYECLQYDEETGECIEQGAGCISSECMQYQTTYFLIALY